MEKTPVRFIWHYTKIFRYYLLSMIICTIIAQVMGQSYPYFLAKIYDTVAGKIGKPYYWEEIFHYTIIVSFLGLCKMIFMEGAMFISGIFIPKSTTIIIRDSFDYVNKHSISFFAKEMTGNISAKVQLLATNSYDFFQVSSGIIYSTFTFLISSIFLSIVSLYYLPVLAVWMLIVLIITWRLGKARRVLSKETSKCQSEVSGMVVDALANYSEIKSFANFNFEKLNLLKSLRKLRIVDSKEQKSRGYIRFIQQSINIGSLIGFLFISIYMLKIGQLNTTTFIFANTLFATMSNTIFEISWTYNNVARIMGNISSALDLLAVEPDIVDRPNAKTLRTKKASISFCNMSFGYNKKNPLFKDINLEIPSGQKVGLVGLSGSGKSTFVKLISRYYDTSEGKICINKHDIKKITQDSLHRHISSIPQDVCLFNRTLFENIKYGKTSATEQEVHAAAKKAYADSFIRQSEHGYQTKVGDRGVILSGGERQRIAIARAILKNAPILIFDEATSALDSQSEQHIQKSLKELMKNKTVIAVAHRLSTLREMDRILVFDKGKIVEDGTHQSLLRKNGVYHKLYTMQVDGFMSA